MAAAAGKSVTTKPCYRPPITVFPVPRDLKTGVFALTGIEIGP
jgi:hypothetical protein